MKNTIALKKNFLVLLFLVLLSSCASNPFYQEDNGIKMLYKKDTSIRIECVKMEKKRCRNIASQIGKEFENNEFETHNWMQKEFHQKIEIYVGVIYYQYTYGGVKVINGLNQHTFQISSPHVDKKILQYLRIGATTRF